MSLEQQVMTDLKTAMLAKDENGLRGLRAIKAAIIIAKTAEGAGGEVKPEEEIKMLQKLIKQRRDSLEIFEQQNRPDLAIKEKEEIAVIERFLPKQMDAETLKAALEKIIADLGATSISDLGKVMGAASKQLGGQADGKTINAAVRTLLSK